jgi:tRNA 2-selenouridine synthase
MSDLALDIKEFLRLSMKLPVIDVRTPAEFEHAHIPGAINLPLFSNEERSVIGTLYLKKGSDDAMTKGLEFIRPKMKLLANSGYDIAPAGEALMHCWRGGMRSSSMAWLLNAVGIKTYTLTGGYRGYRRHTAEWFGKPLKMFVLGGMTGSGKTEVLHSLQLKGVQIIDLENIAVHRGSVFGGIGLSEQPSTEQFENDLFSEIIKLSPELPVFIEDESLAIGKVFIPRIFYDGMSASTIVILNVPFATRLNTIVKAYSKGSREELINGVNRIGKRLGNENAAKAVKLIQLGDIEAAAEIILKYYDRIYARSMSMHNRKNIVELQITGEGPAEIAELITSNSKKWNLD